MNATFDLFRIVWPLSFVLIVLFFIREAGKSGWRAWLGDAFTQFVNGFIAGWRHGVGTGAGTGILTGTTDVSDNMSAGQQIMISGGATLFAMFMNGINQVSSWHENGHPFPNPWLKTAAIVIEPTNNPPSPPS